MIAELLSWVISANTIYFNVLAGSKKRNAWAFAHVGQLMWLVWILLTRTWGFLPMNAALWAVYLRNHINWRKP